MVSWVNENSIVVPYNRFTLCRFPGTGSNDDLILGTPMKWMHSTQSVGGAFRWLQDCWHTFPIALSWIFVYYSCSNTNLFFAFSFVGGSRHSGRKWIRGLLVASLVIVQKYNKPTRIASLAGLVTLCCPGVTQRGMEAHDTRWLWQTIEMTPTPRQVVYECPVMWPKASRTECCSSRSTWLLRLK